MEDQEVGSLIVNTTCLGECSATPAARHELIRVESDGCTEDFGAMLVAGATRVVWVARKCTHNAYNALALRHGVEPPAVKDSFGDWFFDNFLSIVAVEEVMNDPLVRGDWFKRWPIWKRERFIVSDIHDKISPHAMKSMIKRELYVEPLKKARLIQYYANLATQMAFAPIFASLQKHTFHVWDGLMVDGVSVTSSCGKNNVAIARWMARVYERFPNPKFIEIDGKNWDATMQRFHHVYKLRYYRRFGDDFANFVDDCFKTTGCCQCKDGIMVYRMDGTVKSGHNDTTLGNTIINSAINATVARRLGLECDIIVQGDDVLIAYGQAPGMLTLQGLYDEYVASVSRFGVVPVGGWFEGHYKVSFISGCWLSCGLGNFVFVPKLGKLLAKLWWSTTRWTPKQIPLYRAEVAYGLATTCGLLPGYRGLLVDARNRREGAIRSDKQYHHIFSETWPYLVDVDAVARDMVEKYDMTPAEIRDLDDFTYRLMGVNRNGTGLKPGVYRPAFIENIERVDLGDPGDREA